VLHVGHLYHQIRELDQRRQRIPFGDDDVDVRRPGAQRLQHIIDPEPAERQLRSDIVAAAAKSRSRAYNLIATGSD
jgi:hypothetical protein